MEEMIILSPKQLGVATLQVLQDVHRSQEFSARVMVVEVNQNQLEALRGQAGVKVPGELSAADLGTLSAAERLAVEAWQARANKSELLRPGDGLSWGHKDFKAPR